MISKQSSCQAPLLYLSIDAPRVNAILFLGRFSRPFYTPRHTVTKINQNDIPHHVSSFQDLETLVQCYADSDNDA